MCTILPHYEITEQTMALIPVSHPNYHTIAIEVNQTLHITKTPFEIIKRGCLDNFSSLEGRRESVTHLTGFKRKAPIPISVYRNIFVFPTHAVLDWECCWLFYQHVESIVKKKLDDTQSIVIFKNGTEVIVEVPKRELIKQLDKTSLLSNLSSGLRG
ncbi:competence protein ComK [Paucisalibacillus sp. EB02]|uniref:competence protein ComK n=1 Tax=Paucisalibacillus sp. EB02 TaxID=1347087 RepID=UPI0004B8E631|nr:competence protein ComK [Paucisalibacillus sp. EB02]